MKVKEIMTKGVETVTPTAMVRDAAAKMRDLGVGAIPVCDGVKLMGMITDRDIAVRAVAEGFAPDTTEVQRVMTREILYCTEEDGVTDAAGIMEKKQIRRLPVVDKDKRLVGIVSLGDLSLETDTRLAGETLKGISEWVHSEPKD